VANVLFQGRAELTTLAKAYFPKWGYWFVHVLLYICLQSMNIAAIIISAQTMDATLIAVFKWTCALEVYPHFGFIVARADAGTVSPFPDVILISLGFLIVFALTIPLGYVNLDDNIIVQKVFSFIYLSIFLCHIISSCLRFLDHMCYHVGINS